MNKIGTRIYLDQSLLDWLKTEARESHCSMAQVVRTAIVEMKKRREKPSDK